MTGNTHVTEGLTQWICSESHDRLPAAVREKTGDVIYDSVGAMAAGPVLIALTAGEWFNASGQDVMRAVALGYEVGGRHAIAIIRTCEGRTFEDEVWHQPMTRTELEHKFRALVGPTFGAARTAKLHGLLSDVETAAIIRPLMQELHG